MSMGSDSTWVGKKPIRRIGGFSDALSIASDLGYAVAPPPSQWSQNFKEPPSVWGEMLRPIPVALASCTRFFEAMTAMRESFATLQDLRVGNSAASLPTTPGSSETPHRDSDCLTPPQGRTDSSFDDLAVQATRRQIPDQNEAEGEEDGNGNENAQLDRRLSWPPSVKKSGV
ncbi:hypothetical protein F2Q68_00001316 [Brassica cretica]|uniref:Uncharacterized protein n=1 Tax=Brassica cretica TaxID=69181 RepID=A0A8S9JHM9_BRACR|nr:hypothetical protein F2Q68_00001316 [Brassica cretica]